MERRDGTDAKRRTILLAGVTLGSTLAGCIDSDDASNEPPADADPLDYVVITDHDLTTGRIRVSCESVSDVEGDANIIDEVKIEGVVENPTARSLEHVSVQAVVYDEAGAAIRTHTDETNGLEGNSSWSFEMLVLDDADEVVDYEVTLEDAIW